MLQLVETMVRLLGCLNVWDQSDGNPGWTEMAEIGDKVLLEFLLQDNPEYCAYSSSMIYTVWQNRSIDCQEKVCYLLAKVYQAFKMSKNKGNVGPHTWKNWRRLEKQVNKQKKKCLCIQQLYITSCMLAC